MARSAKLEDVIFFLASPVLDLQLLALLKILRKQAIFFALCSLRV